jgi:very-long-chain (3R)-3-hydroxyacyl-CoA dehydratase
MKYFPPMEVFQQETSSAVMGALLVHDVQNERSSAHPTTVLSNPMCLFTETAVHGGAWRCAYKFNSLGVPSALLGLIMNYVVPGYLALYNTVQFGGWSMVLFKCIMHAVNPKQGSLWSSAGYLLTSFQNLALLEAAHSILGMVSSPIGTTAVQLFSRVMLVHAIKYVPSIQKDSNMFLWFLCFAWSITEVVRYSFYACSTVKINISWLTFLRYTLFIALYPLGVLGEMGCIYTGAATLASPPTSNAPFLVRYYLHYLLRIPGGFWLTVVPAYVMGLPMLYGHMLQQRKKILGGGGGAAATTGSSKKRN